MVEVNHAYEVQTDIKDPNGIFVCERLQDISVVALPIGETGPMGEQKHLLDLSRAREDAWQPLEVRVIIGSAFEEDGGNGVLLLCMFQCGLLVGQESPIVEFPIRQK